MYAAFCDCQDRRKRRCPSWEAGPYFFAPQTLAGEYMKLEGAEGCRRVYIRKVSLAALMALRGTLCLWVKRGGGLWYVHKKSVPRGARGSAGDAVFVG